MTTLLIEYQNQAHSNLRELQRLKQHELKLRLSLERIKANIFIFRLLKKTSETWTTKALGITTNSNFIPNRRFSKNHKPPSWRIRIILQNDKISDNNYKVYLTWYRDETTRYQWSPKHLRLVSVQECVKY